MAAIRRCQRFYSEEEGAGSPTAFRRNASGSGALRGRKTVGLRAEALLDQFQRENPVSIREKKMGYAVLCVDC